MASASNPRSVHCRQGACGCPCSLCTRSEPVHNTLTKAASPKLLTHQTSCYSWRPGPSFSFWTTVCEKVFFSLLPRHSLLAPHAFPRPKCQTQLQEHIALATKSSGPRCLQSFQLVLEKFLLVSLLNLELRHCEESLPSVVL